MNLNRITWRFLVKELEKTGKPSEVKAFLNPLRQVAKKIVGDESTEMLVEDCAIQLFLFFLDKDEISMKDVGKLKKISGKIDLSFAKEILKVVMFIHERCNNSYS